MRFVSLRWVMAAAGVMLAVGAQAQTWTFKGSWGDVSITINVADGNCPTVYHHGGTWNTSYKIDKIVGDMVYLKGATGGGCTADGWMTPTTHYFHYWGHEPGWVILDGDAKSNTVPQSMLDALAKLTARAPENPKDAVPGLKVAYYPATSQGQMDATAQVMDGMKPSATGSAETFDISGFSEAANYGVKFTGYIDIPKEDLYRFYTESDDGSMLFIGDTCVVDNNGGHSPRELQGAIKLAAGKHAITCYFDQMGGSQVLTVSYSGGGAEKTPIPASMLFRDPGELKPLAVAAPIFTPTPSGTNGWVATACTNVYEAKNVLSGEGIRWTTNRAMQHGDWLQVDLLKSCTVKSVTLDSSKAPSDAAHGVQLMLSQDGKTFTQADELSADDCAKMNGLVKFTLKDGTTARYLKFIQTGANGPSWWSVYNVGVEVAETKP